METGSGGGRGRYRMTISRMTVDKLGVRLYDRVSAVIAELVANGYDADAEEVTVEAPMGVTLASLSGGVVSDSGYTITVRDNGHGMPPEVVNRFYLAVGSERRKDPDRGDRTPGFGQARDGTQGGGETRAVRHLRSAGGDLLGGRRKPPARTKTASQAGATTPPIS